MANYKPSSAQISRTHFTPGEGENIISSKILFYNFIIVQVHELDIPHPYSVSGAVKLSGEQALIGWMDSFLFSDWLDGFFPTFWLVGWILSCFLIGWMDSFLLSDWSNGFLPAFWNSDWLDGDLPAFWLVGRIISCFLTGLEWFFPAFWLVGRTVYHHWWVDYSSSAIG